MGPLIGGFAVSGTIVTISEPAKFCHRALSVEMHGVTLSCTNARVYSKALVVVATTGGPSIDARGCNLNLTPIVGRSEGMDLADLGKQNNVLDLPLWMLTPLLLGINVDERFRAGIPVFLFARNIFE